MKTAEARDESRVDTVCLRSHQFALRERLDTRGIDYTDDTSGIAKRRRDLFTPPAGRFQTNVEVLHLAVL